MTIVIKIVLYRKKSEFQVTQECFIKRLALTLDIQVFFIGSIKEFTSEGGR